MVVRRILWLHNTHKKWSNPLKDSGFYKFQMFFLLFSSFPKLSTGAHFFSGLHQVPHMSQSTDKMVKIIAAAKSMPL